MTKPSPNAIEHDGGPCPVAKSARVKIHLRNGDYNAGLADEFDWPWATGDKVPDGLDILFYEPLDAPAETEDDDGDFVGCEMCENQRVPHEDAIRADDGYICPKCHAEWKAEYDTCSHEWTPYVDEFGDDVRLCKKCNGIDPESYPKDDAPAVKADELREQLYVDLCVVIDKELCLPKTERLARAEKCVQIVRSAILAASPPAPMPVVDEGMVDRAITAARGNDDWLRCPAAFKQHLRPEMLRALTAALTPPSIATASEGTAAMSEEISMPRQYFDLVLGVLLECYKHMPITSSNFDDDMDLAIGQTRAAMSEVARITRERGEGE